MAIPVRVTKGSAGGGTEFVTATDILAAEVNGDFNALFTEMSNIEDDNVAAAANIVTTKIGDSSATDAAHATTTTPGDSSAQTKPTTLEGEIQQIRHVIERLTLGLDAEREAGSGTVSTFWGDLPARGANLIHNPHFVVQSGGAGTAPDQWTQEGTPTTSAITAKTAAEGDAAVLQIVSDAANEGVSQTLDGLKASTKYLVLAVVKDDGSSTCTLKTENGNAAGSFRDIGVTSSGGGSVEILKGVVETDSTPTSLKVSVESDTSGDDFEIHFVGLYECNADIIADKGPMIVHATDSTQTPNLYPSASTFAAVPGLDLTIYVPGPGYAIDVQAIVMGEANTGADGLVVQLLEDVNGGGDVAVTTVAAPSNGTTATPICVPIRYVKTNPTPGVSYAYSLQGSAVGTATADSNGQYEGVVSQSSLTVELKRVSG
jgi:hypothetical protein